VRRECPTWLAPTTASSDPEFSELDRGANLQYTNVTVRLEV
jgi:hypothetical protein